MGQPIVIENRPGANAVLAGDAVARAPADGYTLLYDTSFALSAALSSKLPYNPTRDFTGIALTAAAPTVLIVNPGFKARTVKEFVELVKANPGRFSYGSAGTGTITHVVPVQLLQTSGGKRETLVGGAQAKKIFWQVGDSATIGTTAHFEGVVLGRTSIAVNTGASATSRLLAQTAVTLQQSAITQPAK